MTGPHTVVAGWLAGWLIRRLFSARPTTCWPCVLQSCSPAPLYPAPEYYLAPHPRTSAEQPHAVRPAFDSPGAAAVQVQDVGLIFLSAMATSVAHECAKAGVGPASTLGTALLTLTGSTFAVGVVIIIVGAGQPPAASAFSGLQALTCVCKLCAQAQRCLCLGRCAVRAWQRVRRHDPVRQMARCWACRAPAR